MHLSLETLASINFDTNASWFDSAQSNFKFREITKSTKVTPEEHMEVKVNENTEEVWVYDMNLGGILVHYMHGEEALKFIALLKSDGHRPIRSE